MLPGSLCGDHTHNVLCSQYAARVVAEHAPTGRRVVWLIVALGLLVAFGPIVWLMPSRRDRQLAKLREAARRAGLVVELVRLPTLDATPEERVSAGGVARDARRACTAYRLPVHGVDDAAPEWLLLRDAAAADPLPGWTGHHARPARRLPSDAGPYWQGVGRAVADLVEVGCVALECAPAAVTWYWLENAGQRAAPEVVADIAACLHALAALQRETVCEA